MHVFWSEQMEANACHATFEEHMEDFISGAYISWSQDHHQQQVFKAMVRKFYLRERILYPGSHWKPGFRNCYAKWQKTAHCLFCLSVTCEYCHLYQTSIYSVVCLHNLNTGIRGSRLMSAARWSLVRRGQGWAVFVHFCVRFYRVVLR